MFKNVFHSNSRICVAILLGSWVCYGDLVRCILFARITADVVAITSRWDRRKILRINATLVGYWCHNLLANCIEAPEGDVSEIIHRS